MLRNAVYIRVCVYMRVHMCVCVTWYFYYTVVGTKPKVNTELFALLIERYLVTGRFLFFAGTKRKPEEKPAWKQNAKNETLLFQEGDMDTEAAADIWVNRNRAHTRIDPLLLIAADGCATKKMTSPRRLCPESKREFGKLSCSF